MWQNLVNMCRKMLKALGTSAFKLTQMVSKRINIDPEMSKKLEPNPGSD
jgi:hypothetical protein